MSAKASEQQLPRAAVCYQDSTAYLSGALNFESVVALDDEVSDWLKGKMPEGCAVDLAGVEYSSSVGIALLLGWMRIAQHAGGRLKIHNIPADMQAMAEVGGLSELFGQRDH